MGDSQRVPMIKLQSSDGLHARAFYASNLVQHSSTQCHNSVWQHCEVMNKSHVSARVSAETCIAETRMPKLIASDCAVLVQGSRNASPLDLHCTLNGARRYNDLCNQGDRARLASRSWVEQRESIAGQPMRVLRGSGWMLGQPILFTGMATIWICPTVYSCATV